MASGVQALSLSLKGINALDPITGRFVPTDLAVKGGRYAQESVENHIKLPKGNYFLTAGLTDLHTHLFKGQDLGVSPDADLLIAGVTRAVDAGSTGGHLFEAFRKLVIEQSAVEIRAFVNIASVGTTSIYLQGELKSPPYANIDLAVNAVKDHSDVVIGIKVRASHDVGGIHTVEALDKAREAADKASVSLMVHLGPAPATVKEILSKLGSGDILTHCYTGWTGNTLVENGKPKDFVLEAIKRGVIFDVGHGAGGFDSTVAQDMISAGYLPNAISTDVHTGSISKVHDLPSVMSKFLALGMTLEDIVYKSTYAPQNIGGFAFSKGSQYPVGELASFALFEVEEGEFEFADAHGHTFNGRQKILPVLIVSCGQVVLDSKNLVGE